jgi:hypothetical protein
MNTFQWPQQLGEVELKKDFCGMAAKEVAGATYGEGIYSGDEFIESKYRRVWYVEREVCKEELRQCDISPHEWSPAESLVPYPYIFLQTNITGADCTPANRLKVGQGPKGWFFNYNGFYGYSEMRAEMQYIYFDTIFIAVCKANVIISDFKSLEADFSEDSSMTGGISIPKFIILDEVGFNANCDLIVGFEVVVWSPENIPTVFWYDASDLTKITAQGSEVTQVLNKSGNAMNLTRPAGTIGPSTGTRTLNGLNVFEWNGNNVLQAEFAYDQNANALNLAIVLQLDAGVATQFFIISGRKTTTTGDRMATRWNSDSFSILGGSNTGSNASMSTASVYPLGSPRILLPTYNGSQSQFRVDGTQLNINGNIGTNPYNTLRIGQSESGTFSVNGYIAEAIAFSDISMREKIEGYVAWKWGLQGILPASHLYKNFRP